MLCAIKMFLNKNSKRIEYKDIDLTSRKYEYLRIETAKNASVFLKKYWKTNSNIEKISGENNPMYNMCWIKNKKTNESKLIIKNSKIPEGWVLGRSLNLTDEQRKKYSEASKKSRKKYPKIWIRNFKLKLNKMIDEGSEIPPGWERGSIVNSENMIGNKMSEKEFIKRGEFLRPIYIDYKNHGYDYCLLKYNDLKYEKHAFLNHCKKYIKDYDYLKNLFKNS